jgi:hypothetical protein
MGNWPLSAGAVMTTAGGRSTTVTVTVSEASRPKLSRIEAVTVCVPRDRLEVDSVPPAPIGPSRFERHWI